MNVKEFAIGVATIAVGVIIGMQLHDLINKTIMKPKA